MKHAYVLAIDLGTTSIKVISMTATGKILRIEQQQLKTLHPSSHYREQIPQEIWKALRQAIAKAILPTRHPLALSFSGAMHSLLAVDGTGNPLTNALLWSDNRSQEQAEKVKNTDWGKALHQATGTPLHPMSPLSKLLWMKEKEGPLFQKACKFISIKEWIIFKLAGVYCIDHSIASATGFFDIAQKKWHEVALQQIGLTAAKFSEPVPVTHTLKLSAKSEGVALGLPIGTPLVVGASDGCLANVGSGVLKKWEMAITVGTSGAVRKTSTALHDDAHQHLFQYILDEQYYVMGGAMNNGGNIVQWFAEKFLRVSDPTKQFSQVEKLAQQVQEGADGLLFLPYVFGERAPFWDAKASGSFIGLRPLHGIEHMARAALEGVLFGIAHITDLLEETTGNIEVVRASGGFAQSPFWVQMLADILHKPIEVLESHENSVMGAAFLAFKALGMIESWEEVTQSISVAQTYAPRKNVYEIYLDRKAIFKEGYQQLYPLFHQLEIKRNKW